MGVQHWDVVIVGAGPAGGRVATHIAERGHSVLLLEEHEELSLIHISEPTRPY